MWPHSRWNSQKYFAESFFRVEGLTFHWKCKRITYLGLALLKHLEKSCNAIWNSNTHSLADLSIRVLWFILVKQTMVIIPKIPAGFLVECFGENRYKIAENTISCHIFPPAFASLQVRSSFSLTRLCRTFPACHIQYSSEFKWFTSCYFNMSTEFFKIRKQVKAPTSTGSLKSHWYSSSFLHGKI